MKPIREVGYVLPLLSGHVIKGNPVTNIEHEFGVSLPAWLVVVLTFLVLLAALLGILTPLGAFLKNACKAFIFMMKRSPDLEHRRSRYRSFARHIEAQLTLLSSKEDWKDERFAELEAEVETEGSERVISWLPVRRRDVRLRRERSLSRALERSRERLIILQGEPGAGKSVALRHVADGQARHVGKSRDPKVVPLYINLKEFNPSNRHTVVPDDLREFILASLTRVNDRDVEQFLEDEFEPGLKAGKWLFLLDSFDEIPGILSATDSDSIVEMYTDVVFNFFHGMHACTGIIASREFKGPRLLRLPRFRVMQLTSTQQKILIKRSGLNPREQRLVYEGVATAPSDLRQMSVNPMFLSLVCEHVRAYESFPENSHDVYESYLGRRFERDEDRIRKRFGVETSFLRYVAEEVAFAMASTDIGLNPTRDQLTNVVLGRQTLSHEKLQAALNAMEYIKIARADSDDASQLTRTFTFAHRRFQEYFATCVVLRESDRVPIEVMLSDGRWRETVVTILQTQPIEALSPILGHITNLLLSFAAACEAATSRSEAGIYNWPPGSLHLLGLINAGMSRRAADIPEAIRVAADRILSIAWRDGMRLDRKWVTEVALVAPTETSVEILEDAFDSKSTILRDAAYESASRLTDPPAGLSMCIRQALVRMAANGRLILDRVGIEAELRRLLTPDRELRAMRLLLSAPFVSTLFMIGVSLNLWYDSLHANPWHGRLEGWVAVGAIALVAILIDHLFILSALGEVQERGAVPFFAWTIRWRGSKATRDILGSFAAFLRFVISGVVVAYIVYSTVRYPGKTSVLAFVILVVVTLYYVTWPLVVVHCAVHACSSLVVAVVSGPIILLMHLRWKDLFWDATDSFVRWVFSKREIDWGETLGFLGFTAFMLLLFAGGFVLWYHESHQWVFIYGGFWVIVFALLSARDIRDTARLAVHRFVVLRALRRRVEPLDPSSLSLILESLTSQHSLLRVSQILRQNVEVQTAATIIIWADLAVAVERRSSGREWQFRDATLDWLSEQPARVVSLIESMDDGVLDEIYRMLEKRPEVQWATR